MVPGRISLVFRWQAERLIAGCCRNNHLSVRWRKNRLEAETHSLGWWTASPEKDRGLTTLDHNQSAHSVGFHVCNPISGEYFRDGEKLL